MLKRLPRHPTVAGIDDDFFELGGHSFRGSIMPPRDTRSVQQRVREGINITWNSGVRLRSRGVGQK